jgi:hypothetical protein
MNNNSKLLLILLRDFFLELAFDIDLLGFEALKHPLGIFLGAHIVLHGEA